MVANQVQLGEVGKGGEVRDLGDLEEGGRRERREGERGKEGGKEGGRRGEGGGKEGE